MTTKINVPTRTVYSFNRTLKDGTVYEYYGSEIYLSRAEAEKAANKRFAKYIDQISIHEMVELEHTAWRIY